MKNKYRYNSLVRYYNRSRRKLKSLIEAGKNLRKQGILKKRLARLFQLLSGMQQSMKIGTAAVALTAGVLVANPQIASAQTFGPAQTAPFSLTSIYHGFSTYGDLDNDGDMDLLFVNSYNQFYYYENTGSSSAPSFPSRVQGALGLPWSAGTGTRPTFADLDNDGDLDLLTGDNNGNFNYYQNSGSAAVAAFGFPVANPFGLTSGSGRYPALADLDGDGDLDLLSASSGSDFFYFENTGSSASPSFGPSQTNPMGLSHPEYGNTASFGDLDNDGDFDLISGSFYAGFVYFENTGTNVAPAFAGSQSDPFGLPPWQYFQKPVLVDLDDDGDLDMMTMGYEDFTFIENTSPVISVNTFNGSVSSDWGNPANWSMNAVPTVASDAEIPDVVNDPVISTSAGVADIELEPGATLTVNSGGTLTLDGSMSNSGAVTIENGGSFLQGGASSVSGSGSFSIKRQGSAALYNMWSSPITAQSGAPGTSYVYNSAASTQDDSDDAQDPGWNAFNGTMAQGVGYAGLGGNLATFTGTPNNGNINASLFYSAFDNTYTQTSGGTPFNLVGNPYPSAISAASFLAANPDLDGTIYLWNDNGSNNYSRTDYAYWNGTGGLGTGGGATPNGFIGTAQGFMVRALSGGAVADFTNAQRVAGNNAQFHKPNAADSRLWFSVSNQDISNQILIGVLQDATDDEDRMYDAVKLNGNSGVSLSAIANETEHAIMAFPPSFIERSVPLNVSVNELGSYTFMAEVMENFEYQNVYFVDTKTSQSVQLFEGTEITITLDEGEYEDRFYLNFYPDGFVGIPEASENAVLIYSSNESLYLSSTEIQSANSTMQLFDVNGRLIMQESGIQLSGDAVIIPLSGIANGVYVVRLTTDQKVVSKKIVKQ